MVLENIFPKEWVRNKAIVALFLGWAYAVIGIVIAKLIFPADPSLVAVAITSILLIPSLQKLYDIEFKALKAEKSFSFKRLYMSNKDATRVYLGLFLGMFLIYLTAAVVLPSLQVNSLFKVQLNLRGAAGTLDFNPSLFFDILGNNWWVLIATFLISLLIADGGIFMITWNASVWGTIFGITAKCAAAVSGQSALYVFSLVFLIIFPHMVIEALSYILAAIAGVFC